MLVVRTPGGGGTGRRPTGELPCPCPVARGEPPRTGRINAVSTVVSARTWILSLVTSPADTDNAAPQLSAGPRPAPGPAADEGLCGGCARSRARRRCTTSTCARRSGRRDTVYAMAEVALAAIDHVTLNMDFDTGADHDQIVARLLPRVGAQAPDRPVAEHGGSRAGSWST
ncbi:hypothetical protein SBADM41S_11729 [Streptomyces badius]